MRGVDIDWLIKRKRYVARDKRLVDSRVELGDWRFRETRHELLHISDTLGTGSRIPRSKTVPELEIYTKV